MPDLHENPLVKEHVKFLEFQAKARAEQEQSKVGALADLDEALAYLTAVRAEVNALVFA